MSYLKDKGYNPVVIGVDLFIRFWKFGVTIPLKVSIPILIALCLCGIFACLG